MHRHELGMLTDFNTSTQCKYCFRLENFFVSKSCHLFKIHLERKCCPYFRELLDFTEFYPSLPKARRI